MANQTDNSQAVEGYGCSCGKVILDLKEFRSHLMHAALQDGKGTHKSLGRVNTQTGEIIMPPYEERSDAEKQASRYAKRSDGGKSGTVAGKATEIASQAVEVKFVPRVLTCDYSSVIRSGQTAATQEWGWDKDMPLGDFLDTVIYYFFKEHGITLAAYVVQAPKEEEVIAN